MDAKMGSTGRKMPSNVQKIDLVLLTCFFRWPRFCAERTLEASGGETGCGT